MSMEESNRDSRQAVRQPKPVNTINTWRMIAPATLRVACWYNARIGTPVAVLLIPARSDILKNMAMLYPSAEMRPIPTVERMLRGIIRSGLWISSAMCVATSKQAKDLAHIGQWWSQTDRLKPHQLGLINPTMNAIALFSQPVSLTNVANTNLAVCFVLLAAGTAIVITKHEMSDT